MEGDILRGISLNNQFTAVSRRMIWVLKIHTREK